MPSILNGRAYRVPYDPPINYSDIEFEDDDDIGLPSDDDGIGLPSDDDAIGLPPEPIDFDDDNIGLENIPIPDDDLTGLEDDHVVLNQQRSSANEGTPTPQDPVHTQSPAETKETRQQDIIEELICTLASKVAGYKNIHELKKDFMADSGYIADLAAQEFGLANFEAFVQSTLLSPYISIIMVDGEPAYIPKDCSKFAHIRSEMEMTENAQLLNFKKAEQEKYARAQLPKNLKASINGRRIICEIVHELEKNCAGGKVLWNQIQARYREKFGKELAGDELRNMFQRDKAIRIIENNFSEDLVLFDSNMPGHFFVKLSKPYDEIIANLDEQLRLHREGSTLINTTKSGPAGIHHGNKSRRKEIYATEQMYPNQVHNFDTKRYMDTNTLFVEQNANEQSTSAQALLNNDVDINVRSKFSFPDNAVSRNGLENGVLNEQHECSSSRMNAKVNWSQINAYKIGGNEPNAYEIEPNNTTSINSNGSNCDDKKKSKKTQYTSAIIQDFTDSEDDDNETVVDANKSEITEQLELANKFTALPNKTVLTPLLSIHQTGIQNYMQKKTEERKNFGTNSIGLNSIGLEPEQMTMPASNNNNNLPKTPANNKKVGYTVSSSEDESTIDNDNEMSRKSDGQPVNNLSQQKNGGKICTAYQPPTSTINQENPNTLPHSQLQPPVAVVSPAMCTPLEAIVVNNTTWALMDKIEELRVMANQMHLNHEVRRDECSFIFHKGSKLLAFTEFHDKDKVRASKYIFGRGLIKERHYPKVDWEMFLQTICGVLVEVFGAIIPESVHHHNSNNCSDLAMPTNLTNATTSYCWGQPPDSDSLFTDANPYASTWARSHSNSADVEMENDPIPPTINSNTTNNNSGYKLQECTYKQSHSSNVHFPTVPNNLLNCIAPYPTSRCTADGETFLCFFTKIYGFSNHFPSDFTLQGLNCCCSEQYYMYRKAKYFGFNSTAKAIMQTRDSTTIKRLGCADNMRQRQKDGLEPDSTTFDHEEWRRVKPDIMMNALRAKFKQNIFLYNMLIQTKSAYLVETSPNDYFWGIGCHMDAAEITNPLAWRGKNFLGQLLMRLRKEFIEQINEYESSKEDEYNDTW